jgi:curved DNA-binding protein
MKYKDYYAILGLERTADIDSIKKSYRRLARKYHPDVSKEQDAEEKFKEVAEAYETLKDPEKRTAYDRLGSQQAGQDFQPPPDMWQEFNSDQSVFQDIDLADFLATLQSGKLHRQSGRSTRPIDGQDFEVIVHLTLEEAHNGTQIPLEFSVPEIDAQGFRRQVPRKFSARIPKGCTDGQRVRVPGKGGEGIFGGKAGNLYLIVQLHPHSIFRVDDHDLYLDLPLAPWEAVLGCKIKIPTLSGLVELSIPPGTRAAQKFRLNGRGLSNKDGTSGNLYAIVQIVVPSVLNDHERDLFKQLASASVFNPRGHFFEEVKNAK